MTKQTDGIRLVDDMIHDFNHGRQELVFVREMTEELKKALAEAVGKLGGLSSESVLADVADIAEVLHEIGGWCDRSVDRLENAESVFANHEKDLKNLSLRMGDGVKV